MGTRSDFYVGRGPGAEWLGSLALDGYPDGRPACLLGETTEAGFRAAVTALLAARPDATAPGQGWPWPWENSRLTDWAYAFDGGLVWGSRFGGPWHVPGAGEEPPGHPSDADGRMVEPCTDGRRVEFPDMTARRKVTLGPRSGLFVFRCPD